ncbi:MAG TPA: hypothetical protein VFN97_03685 [Actinospica sp.]|nr:hypothetical protein [Actinospica sp.]
MPPNDSDSNPHLERGRDLARLALGLADFGLEQAEGLIRRARDVVKRNDYADLAADAHGELKARGDVVLARFSPGPEAHMEALARIARRDRDLPGSA